MKNKPLILFISRNGKDEEILHFPTINEAKSFLRSRGLKFSNSLISDLGSDSVTLFCGPFCYELQEDFSMIRRKRVVDEKGND